MLTARERIVITGGAGFIGTHLAQSLCDAAELVLVDNLRRDSLRGVPELRDHPHVSFRKGDVLDRAGLADAFGGAEVVVHLAAIAGVSSYYDQPLETLRVNLLGTVNVLDAAVAAGVKRIVYLSTSEVFGPDAMWVSEDSPCHIGPSSDRRWVYATSKLAGEQFVMRYAESFGLACTVVRPFNVYGPRQLGEGAVANFCAAAVRGEPLTVYGDGTAIRAWCYVSDFVEAVVRILRGRQVAGQTLNVGNPREVVTTLGLARLVAQTVPGARIVHRDVKRTDVRSRIPDVARARRVLDWEPRVDLAEGIRRTLDWHRTRGES
jgi:nucleoside-diphosphate-sugar epimerase